MSGGESAWGAPETAVMRRIREALDGETTPVLATIVGVEGSAYRRPGAKMLVSEAGGVGSITAGCLEDEVLALADEVREGGRPILETFDLTGDDDVWGLGVGCNGVIDILLEPLDEGYRPVVEAYHDGDDVVVFTVLDSDHPAVGRGDRLYAPDGTVPVTAGDGWPDWLVGDLEAPAGTLHERGAAETVSITRDGATVDVFVDAVTAPPELLVFGTGHDVAPLVEFATRVDFRVTVVGFRGGNATPERFPAADTVRSTSPARLRDELDVDADTYTVVMTHNFIDDTIAVDELLRTPTPYVGLMGPTERFEEIVDDLAADGRELTDAELDRVYTPVGVDLGSGTPHGIALSIVAELLAVRNDREPKHLRDRRSHIHERLALDTGRGDD
jgi:xanthine dehydrogenase accessory factor